jgi:hypothetical protein
MRPAVELGQVISSMLGESGLAGWPHPEPPQVGEVWPAGLIRQL